MSNSLNFLFFLHKVRRWWQIRHQLVKCVYLTDCLQQQKESAKRHIARCAILKLTKVSDLGRVG